ncbi:MAG TPA: 30S ribosomal protein S17 [Proteobacteria bacterium]|nr:30S ribosomal protein S17 [Pseudomonadota bacterium]
MKEAGHRKTQIGIVVSDKMDKTIVVQVERLFKHPVYKKYVRRRARYKAHDEGNTCKVGDKVMIEEGRPLSREKRWGVRQVIERAV